MADQTFERTLDGLGGIAVSLFGDGINTPVFAGITWRQVMACLFILFCVALIERAFRWILLRKAGPPSDPEAPGTFRSTLLHAASKPLSLFVWVYGLHFSIIPLYPNSQSGDGRNPLRAVIDAVVDVVRHFGLYLAHIPAGGPPGRPAQDTIRTDEKRHRRYAHAA